MTYRVRNRVTLGVFALLTCAACSPPPAHEAADVLLVNARVYTLSWDDPHPDGSLADNAPHDDSGWRPDAESVALRDGRIVFVGTTTDADRWRGDDTEVVDLGGATLLPGLVDSHTHVFNLGAALSRVSLFDVHTEEQAVARIAERAKSVPPGEWIVGQGWDEGAWADRYPDKRLLTEAVPKHPVFMRSLHSFAGWGNQMALDRAGITATTVAPSGGEIRRDPDGEPSGLLLNNAVGLLENAIPAPSRHALTKQVTQALQRMLADGYVTVHDAGLSAAELHILQELEDNGDLPLRVYAMLSVRDEPFMREWLARGPDKDSDSMLVTRSIKAFYDGALGSRGARLLEDYADAPGHRGVSGNEYGFDESLTAELMNAGFQVGIHAIGDAGNRETLDFLAGVLADNPDAASGRHRIEHAQVLHPHDLPRLAALGITASMEPPHAVEDKPWAEDRLGPQRIRGAYAWRSLRRSGARVIFNSDNPGSDHSIFYGLHAAVTRRDKMRQPDAGWYPDEALGIDEAVRAYTRWPAHSAFRETRTGTIAVGRWADLTALDIDPFVLANENPGAILDGRVVLTMVAGDIAFRD